MSCHDVRKHDCLVHCNVLAAATMLAPLSVVKLLYKSEFKPHSLKTSSKASR